MSQIYKPTPANIKLAAELLQSGELIAFPTETVYGLGGDATNEVAVKRIFEAKGRPSYDPLIVHIAEPEMVQHFADLSNKEVKDRYNKIKDFWPGPISVVLPLRTEITDGIAPSVTANLQTVAFRIPSHPVALQLLKNLTIPIAAPSANQFSYVSPTTPEHVLDSLGDKVSFILDGGACSVGLESTVISLAAAIPTILRPGVVTKEELEAKLGEVLIGYNDRIPTRSNLNLNPLPSPGMLDKHYSPKTPMALIENFNSENIPPRTGMISFSTQKKFANFEFTEIQQIGYGDDLNKVATRLYQAIRQMDKLDLDLILIDSCQESGIGSAIMDRISRAASKGSQS